MTDGRRVLSLLGLVLAAGVPRAAEEPWHVDARHAVGEYHILILSARGSLFLGRMTEAADGVSFLVEA